MLPPEPLGSQHEIEPFSNGRHASLDDWLRQRARGSEGLSARTYVSCATERVNRVVGYYAISTAAAHRVAIPSAKLRKGMPAEVPLLLLGRLAVDAAFQGQGLGAALLADALKRCAAASAIAGVRGVITHAIDDEAVQFYARYGFVPAPPLGASTLLMPSEVLRATIALPNA
ncbi:GNAT family N-acetyltransferase [Phenylobacterium sp.]|uniref:GNAT family N-acetyltransferase n=1 Tax=Phenylobacterium sp. TaxID=1871053 RepID=UPI0025ECDFC3|nr:GNAT family N-acetyltransferase [Phenylobacterium sp.]